MNTIHTRSTTPAGTAAAESSRAPRAPRARLLGLGAAGLTAAILAAPAPVLAHDTLVESAPQQGASSEEAPGEVELTFSAQPQDVGAQIEVTGPDGSAVTEGEPQVQGNAMIQDLADAADAPGEYTVEWRVVSSDGHPIEGTFDYTVAGGTDAAAMPAESGAASQPAGTEPTEAEAQDASGAEEAQDAGGVAGWLIVVGGVVVVGAVAAAIVMMRKMSR